MWDIYENVYLFRYLYLSICELFAAEMISSWQFIFYPQWICKIVFMAMEVLEAKAVSGPMFFSF